MPVGVVFFTSFFEILVLHNVYEKIIRNLRFTCISATWRVIFSLLRRTLPLENFRGLALGEGLGARKIRCIVKMQAQKCIFLCFFTLANYIKMCFKPRREGSFAIFMEVFGLFRAICIACVSYLAIPEVSHAGGQNPRFFTFS